MKKVAIIGASGTLGKIIARKLSALPNIRLIQLSRNTSLGPEGFLVFEPEKDDWKKIGDVDILINAAGIIHESKDAEFEKVHVQLVQKIIENRHIIGDPRIIQISALGADEKHPIAFLRTKGIADAMLIKQANTFVLRPSIVCTSNTLLVKKFKMMFDISKYFFNHAVLPASFLKTRIQPIMEYDFAEIIEILCTQHANQALIELPGAEQISFQWLMDLAGEVRKQKMVALEIPKNLVEAVTKNFISIWFPGLINYDQFQLLFKDNIAEKTAVEELLGRPVQSTLEFWKKEFATD
jgi:uncharacterized protein YbjT (DUF2867 family)